MMTQVEIKKLTRQDAKMIFQICLDANNGESTWKLSSFESELDNLYNVYLGYEIGGSIIGFIGCSLIFDSLAINNFAISPEYKRQGIGEKLLKALLNYGKKNGADNFILEVRISNKSAISLYEKVGFRQIDRRKNYYEQPTEDAYIFQMTI